MQKTIDLQVFMGVFQSVIMMECCACRRVLGYKEGFGVDGISHGYCPECEKAMKDAILNKMKVVVK